MPRSSVARRTSRGHGPPAPPRARRRSGSGALGFYGYTVGDVMSRPAISVRPGDPLRLACARLSQRGISGLPVVDAQLRPVGVLSQKDVLRLLHDRAGLSLPGGLFDLLLDAEEARRSDLLPACRAVLDRTLVSEVMTLDPITIDRAASMDEAVQLLMARRINRLPVTHRGVLVGIVTRHDLLSGLRSSGS
ncbi:MAG: CBS domain-containing protein [Thermoplasmata archaeon]|nr:CBS domain-containing protein [Thermoplasmata archaeon]